MKYGLKDRCVGQRPIESWNAGLEEGLTESGETVKAFISTARKLIEDGAEVIIPGCSLMSPTMRLTPGAEDLYPGGLTEVDGAPVVDVLSVTVKMAETMASLYRAGSGWISRKLYTPGRRNMLRTCRSPSRSGSFQILGCPVLRAWSGFLTAFEMTRRQRSFLMAYIEGNHGHARRPAGCGEDRAITAHGRHRKGLRRTSRWKALGRRIRRRRSGRGGREGNQGQGRRSCLYTRRHDAEEDIKPVKTALDTCGRIDILINNAGYMMNKPTLRSPGRTGTAISIWTPGPTCV